MLKIFILIVTILLLSTLYACDKTPSVYVEVEALRIESANVFLSPSGETAKRQLEVEILPANATNRKLIYYIPSAYLKYVTVNETGLITALLTTEEDMKVPLTVTSSTNRNATLQINLVVEYVPVKEVSFTEDSIDLLYKGVGKQLYVEYTPYHAQDGRTVTYSSLNENIATVSSTGVVSAVNVGSTHIKATCKISTGKAIEGRIPVKVNYVKGRYRLEVSDTTPQYHQILGDFKAINFNLMILEEQSDPNPRIQWYVDSKRVIGLDSFTQYQHIPSVSTRTSYRVSVKVTPYKEPEQELFSEMITVYNVFRGFEFDIKNITVTTKGYQYGDTATFPLTVSSGSVIYYDWYLKKKNAVGKGIYVGSTVVSNKDLVRRLNLEGDFSLTAEGKDAAGNAVDAGQKFDFSVTRFNTGDTLIISPKLLQEGMPPESYNWYKYELDSLGNRIGGSTFVGSSVYGKQFYYSLPSNGQIELVALAMLEGVVATVNNQPFEGSTGVIRVFGNSLDSEYAEDIINSENFDYHYAVSNNQKISNLIIEGVNKNNQNLVNIHWNATSNSPSYVVEIIKKNGNIYLLDSAVDTTIFGDYYVYVPNTIVTLEDSFSVRVKQKGGLFSERYYYGYINESGINEELYFAKIDSSHYVYLSNISENINRYTLSMIELGEILDYIMLYTPRTNALIAYGVQTKDSIVYDTFTVRLKIGFAYSEALAEKYPVTVEEGAVGIEYLELYKMLLGAQKSYCETGEYRFSLNIFSEDGTYGITVMKATGVEEQKSTPTIEFVKGSSVYYAQIPYGLSASTFAIDLRKEINVSTTDQLYSLAEQGKCPVPSNDAVATVYRNAKNVVRSIIGEGMTDRQKVLAFFDYLTTNVVYDTQINALLEDGETKYSVYNYDSFHLEGIFNKNKGVCDGIAKAMSLLCAIEGIYCVKISGSVDGVGHSWNKVLIDDIYYNLDATYGIKTSNSVQYSNHKFFLMTDSELALYYTNAVVFGEYNKANTAFDFYETTRVNGLAITVNSQEELKTLLDSFGDILAKKVYLEIKVGDTYLASNTIDDIMINLILNGNKAVFEHIKIANNRIIVVMQ